MKTKATLPLILILLISGMGCHFMGMSPTPPPTNLLLGQQWERTSVIEENNTKDTRTHRLFLSSDGTFVQSTDAEIVTDDISSTMIAHVHGNYTVDGKKLILMAETANVEFLPVEFWEGTTGGTQSRYEDKLLSSYPLRFSWQIKGETLTLTIDDGEQVAFQRSNSGESAEVK